MNNTIDQDLCKQCKRCMEVCPCNILGINQQGEMHFIPERQRICQHCGQCMCICSTKAISVDGLSYEQDLYDLPANHTGYQEFISFLSHRRSIRNYKEKPVSSEMISKILEAVAYAPYGAAREKTHISIVNDRQKIETALPLISRFLDDIVKYIENPVTSFMIRRKRGPETFNTLKHHLYPISKLENYKLEYGDRITRGAPCILIFHGNKRAEEHTNNSLVHATYAMLAAHSVGLGASMNGIVPAAVNRVQGVREIFQVPDLHEAVISLIIGHPRYTYKRAIRRRNQPVHWVT
jgi:nitroreductase/NAD-dependent dihydropyrimidine dehydrogenase PreA subunit